MSDDAPTPTGDAAHPAHPAAAPPSQEPGGPQDAVVPLTKHTATGSAAPGAADGRPGDAAGVAWPSPASDGPGETRDVVPPPEPSDGGDAGAAGVTGPAGAPNPWAAPGDGDRGGPGYTVAADGPWAPAAPDQASPSVHDQRTVTSLPAADNPQPWAGPFGAPQGGAPQAGVPQAGSPLGFYPPPDPATAAGGPPPNPFAPPAHDGAVPPPPIAPDGPGQVPYGYPGGYGYPSHPHYGGGAPGLYGWGAPGAGDSNGMGVASLVLGILADVLFCLWPLAVVLGILGVVFGAIGRGKARRGEASNPGQALAGIICGAVGIVLAVGLGVLVIVAP